MSCAETRPCVIIVRDGWGKNPYPQWNNANAVFLAKHPVADRLMAEYPSTLIHTSGFDVGLPEGTMGNSEVGHQNIGAGRIVDQESVAITKQIRNGEFFENAELNQAVDQRPGKPAEICTSSASSATPACTDFSNISTAAWNSASRRGLTRVFLHAFTDGRDTSPNTGLGYISQIEAKMKELGVGKIATVSGRY